MAESVTIARPYAEALFQAAKESGNLAKWSEQVSLLGQVAANPEAREAIGDPNVAAPQLVDLFRSACGTAIDAELSNFIQLLAKNDRLALPARNRCLVRKLQAGRGRYQAGDDRFSLPD